MTIKQNGFVPVTVTFEKREELAAFAMLCNSSCIIDPLPVLANLHENAILRLALNESEMALFHANLLKAVNLYLA